MADKVIIKNRSFEIPPKTLKTLRMVQETESAKDPIAQYTSAHEFVKHCIGEQQARDLFGSDNIEDIDLQDVEIAFNAINLAHKERVRQAKAADPGLKQFNDITDRVAATVTAVDKLK